MKIRERVIQIIVFLLSPVLYLHFLWTLKKMERQGLVTSRRVGGEKYYRLTEKGKHTDVAR